VKVPGLTGPSGVPVGVQLVGRAAAHVGEDDGDLFALRPPARCEW